MILIFATNNSHKIEEVKLLLPDNFDIITLAEAGVEDDIPEPFHTFQENALAKAKFVNEKTQVNCFAEDSGLCVKYLDNAPGVFSARYAGEPRSDKRNNELLLENLKNATDRRAYYNATIALIWDDKHYFFSGECEGTIATEPKGRNGFGYDPIFIPKGYEQSFGELSPEVKSQLSHRKKAVAQLVKFLENKI